MEFTLRIELGNDAMRSPDDIAAALRRVALKVQGGTGTGKVWDVNGNAVGAFDITDDPYDNPEES